MKAGDTFFLRGGAADRHLRVIISDPSVDPDRVIFISVTSYDATKEEVCLLYVGDHPFVTHKSCVAYWSAREASLQQLVQLRDGGQLRPGDPVSAELLVRIRRGESLSKDIKPKALDVRLDQGLLD